jgi:FRG domain
MTAQEVYQDIKQKLIPDNIEIKSLDEAFDIHDNLFIPFRVKLYENGLNGFMPHYRGEQKYGWDILSGVFRPPFDKLSSDKGKNLEKLAVTAFEDTIKTKIGDKVLRNIFNHEKFGKEWDLLFQAQHGGVKTTLTDWTGFIQTALFFATEISSSEEIENSDAQLWCLMVPIENIISDSQFFPKESMYNLDPFNIDNVYLINPSIYIDNVDERIFEYRMYKQGGRFLAMPNNACNVPINKHDMFKDFLFHIRIPKDFKQSIRQALTERGITRQRMYADENPVHDNLIKDINNKIFTLD